MDVAISTADDHDLAEMGRLVPGCSTTAQRIDRTGDRQVLVSFGNRSSQMNAVCHDLATTGHCTATCFECAPKATASPDDRDTIDHLKSADRTHAVCVRGAPRRLVCRGASYRSWAVLQFSVELGLRWRR